MGGVSASVATLNNKDQPKPELNRAPSISVTQWPSQDYSQRQLVRWVAIFRMTSQLETFVVYQAGTKRLVEMFVRVLTALTSRLTDLRPCHAVRSSLRSITKPTIRPFNDSPRRRRDARCATGRGPGLEITRVRRLVACGGLRARPVGPARAGFHRCAS